MFLRISHGNRILRIKKNQAAQYSLGHLKDTGSPISMCFNIPGTHIQMPMVMDTTPRIDCLANCRKNLCPAPNFWMAFAPPCASTGEYELLYKCFRIPGDNKQNIFSSVVLWQLKDSKLFERHGNLNPNNSASKGSLSYAQYPMPTSANSNRKSKQAPAWMENY